LRGALLSLALLLAWPAAADAASVKVVDCTPALDPAARSATFDARVRAARGSDRMQLRFTLQVRDEGFGTRWRKVVAPGFDEWLTSALVLRSTRATSAQCRQPDMRADLVPLRLDVAPGPDAGTYRYRAVVRNAGRTAAGPF